jgi:DKNYY family
MKLSSAILTGFLLIILCCCHQPVKFKKPIKIQYRDPKGGLVGNDKIEFIQNPEDGSVFTDPINDTINYKLIIDNIYKDTAGNVFRLCVAFNPVASDTLLYLEYYRNYSDFINLATYRIIKDKYFSNKNKVYLWWGNSDGDYPVEIKDADPQTFTPFDNIAGGLDKNNVYYGGPPGDYEKIKGADPKSIRVLNPKQGCWNCGNCYFVDDKNVFFGLKKIAGADAATFKLSNLDSIDAEDKNFRYFEGQPRAIVTLR